MPIRGRMGTMNGGRTLMVSTKTSAGQEAESPLTLTLSRPTGEGTARSDARSFQSGWIRRPTEDDSPSPIRWERAGPSPRRRRRAVAGALARREGGSGFVRAGGVRVNLPQNLKLFLHGF